MLEKKCWSAWRILVDSAISNNYWVEDVLLPVSVEDGWCVGAGTAVLVLHKHRPSRGTHCSPHLFWVHALLGWQWITLSNMFADKEFFFYRTYSHVGPTQRGCRE